MDRLFPRSSSDRSVLASCVLFFESWVGRSHRWVLSLPDPAGDPFLGVSCNLSIHPGAPRVRSIIAKGETLETLGVPNPESCKDDPCRRLTTSQNRPNYYPEDSATSNHLDNERRWVWQPKTSTPPNLYKYADRPSRFGDNRFVRHGGWYANREGS